MEFRILGPIEVSEDGRPVALQGGKPRALLAVLLLHAGEAVPTGELIDALWGERPPETVAKVLQTYVSQLRKILGPALETRPGAYRLTVEPGGLDLLVFQQRFADGRRALAEGRAQDAATSLRDALALWRGPALAEFRNEPFAIAELRRLEEARIAAIEDRIDADLACGLARELVPELEGLVAEHPLRERLRGQLMLALYRSGRQADALRVYREGRIALVEELGLDPGPDLQRLETAILVQDPALAGERPAPPLPVNGRPAAPGGSAFWTRRRLAYAAVLVFGVGILAAALDLRLGGGGGAAAIPANSVAVLDPRSGKVKNAIAVGVRPQSVAVGEGSAWIANSDDRTISRIDARTLALSRTIPVGVFPSDVAFGIGGVWVPSGPLGQLVRIDPGSNRASQPFPAGNGCGGQGESATIGAGAVWLACDLIPGAFRVDARTHLVDPFALRAGLLTTTTGSVVPHFSAITVGGGVLWIVDSGQDRVTELDPATRLPVRQIDVGRAPAAVAYGFGSVWVANAGDGTLSRIDVSGPGRPAHVQAIPVGGRPVDVAAGSGSVWVADAGTRTVVRVDPGANQVASRVALKNPPGGIAVGEGHVWVTVREP